MTPRTPARLLAASILLAAGAPAALGDITVPGDPRADFLAQNPGTAFSLSGDRITTIYGPAFSSGATPVESADVFRQRYAPLFGVAPEDLRPESPLHDRRHTQSVKFDPATGEYAFTLVYFSQVNAGIPVFRSDLRLLVRNDEGSPLTLARSGLRDLGGFDAAAAGAAGTITPEEARNAALGIFPLLDRFGETTLVVWPGGGDAGAARPALAHQFVGWVGTVADPDYQKWLFLVHANTGEILHRESQIFHGDATGTINGMATVGELPAEFAPEVLTPLAYARAAVSGGDAAFADDAGVFSVGINGGSALIESAVRGEWFRVFNQGGPDSTLSLTATPPDPVEFVHNTSGAQFATAEVNAYVHANIARDFVLQYNPDFPDIGDQVGAFDVNVNINQSCNAFYNGNSINFYRAGGSGAGCPNTAFSTVVYHEYGHHLVNRAGSAQGQFGEGYSDTFAMVIVDDPGLGYGFRNDPNVPLRSAENNLQYPCAGAIHSCGRLISGAVWSVRNEMILTEPDTYRDIMGSLVINSVLFRGDDAYPNPDTSLITPQIAIDFLTLDDDDADITNGTPHYYEIAAGMGAHNLDAPVLRFDYLPSGRPELIDPNGGTIFTVSVNFNGLAPAPGTTEFFYDAGDGFVEATLIEISPNLYEVVLPAFDCGDTIQYYVSAETVEGLTISDPLEAPLALYRAVAATTSAVALTDEIETDTGWTAGDPGDPDDATSGFWNRMDPEATIAQPEDDHTVAGTDCWVTDGRAGSGDGTFDVDNGKTTLISPALDLTAPGEAFIGYWRWYSNHAGAAPNADVFTVSISPTGAAPWTTVEVVGPAGPEASGGWYYHEFRVSDFVTPSAATRLRFVAADESDGSLVEAAVDDLTVIVRECSTPSCPADWNGDTVVTSDDYFAFLTDFFAGEADFNDDGVTTSDDYFAFLTAFFKGC